MPTAASLSLRSPSRRTRGQKDLTGPLTVALALYAVSTLLSMAVMSICAAIAAVLLVWTAGGPRGVWAQLRAFARVREFNRYAWASAALLGALLLSLVAARIAPVGWGGQYVHPNFAELGKSWYFAWPVLLAFGLRQVGEAGRKKILRSWLVVFGVLAVMGVVQHFTGWPKAQHIPSSPGRYHAILLLGHHLSVASILIFPFFAALDLMRVRSQVLSPWVLRAAAAFGLVTLFLTYSRTLWVALPIGIVIWAARSLKRRELITLLVVVAAALVIASRLPEVQQRIATDLGIGDRQKLWLANWEFLKLRPLTGVGFRCNLDASAFYLQSLPNNGWIFSGHAHNNLVDALGSMGLFGGGAWLAWCGIVLLIAWRCVRKPGVFAWGLVCAWIVFHINGLTQVNFWEGKVMHQMMWVVAWSFAWFKPEMPGARNAG